MQPGWYPDPAGRYEHRYFNGERWTADAATDGQRFVDPFGAEPSGGAVTPLVPAAPAAAGNGLATASMSIGIIGAGFGVLIVFFYLAFPLGLLAFVLGLVARRQASNLGGIGSRQALAAVVLGPLAMVLGAVGLAVMWDEMAEAWQDAVNQVAYDVEIDECRARGEVALVSGAITNRGRSPRDYEITLDVVPRGSSTSIGRGTAVATGVDQGERESFTLEIPLDTSGEIRCSVEGVESSS